jgi:hypothetical protein
MHEPLAGLTYIDDLAGGNNQRRDKGNNDAWFLIDAAICQLRIIMQQPF